MSSHYLAHLFEPASVAIIGASERPGAIGSVLIDNMLAAHYRGKLYPVNPKHRSVANLKCHAGIADVPQPVDLAVIATPAPTVPRIIEECGMAGVRSAVVITAGFSEVGGAGVELESALVTHARRHGVRVVGPNCLGIMRPEIGLNATFARGGARPGALGLISQSGAICTALLDWARPNEIGFSSVISLGGSADVDFGEILDYLVFDSCTEQILLYIEGIRDARRFMSALRAAARVKPVIVMKSGRHPTGVRAAISHTGAMVGADDVFDAAIRRTGAVRVTTIGELVAAAQALSAHVRPKGNRLAIVTNGGGPGVLAADRASDLGLPLAELSAGTIERLEAALPANWSQGNPLDLIGDADAARYDAAVGACLADENVDGVLAILTPQAMTAPTAVAEAVAEWRKHSTKPLLAAWMGEEQVLEGRAVFRRAGIPVFRTPEPAVEMFAHLSSYYRNQRMLLETPGPRAHDDVPDLVAARGVIDAALREKRSVLTPSEAKALLAAFQIPVVLPRSARSAEEAVTAAESLGYPVAMKIDSPDVTHKTDVGGVVLSLMDAAGVRSAWTQMLARVAQRAPKARVSGVTLEAMLVRPHARELLVGVLRDPVFGPAITFGAGGVTVEVLADRAVALPPLNSALTREMIASTRVSRLLASFRGMPAADLTALENVLLSVSAMVCELPEIREMDINPVLVDESGAIALDARVVVEAAHRSRTYAHMAIHPYPAHLAGRWQAPDGREVVVRPIRPEDAEIEREFVRGLSPSTRYLRFMSALKELTPAMLARFTQVDYEREMAFIATVIDDSKELQIGVCRYATDPDGQSCEFALVIGEAWQGVGLGRHLLRRLIDAAKERGLTRMHGEILASNRGMLDLVTHMGFELSAVPDTPSVQQAQLDLVGK
jgi:acetyltransferase